MGTLTFRQWRVFSLIIGFILVTGLNALNNLGRQEDPTLTNLFAMVMTPWPGASPSRVESLVTEKIETKLFEIPEIDEIKSTSSEGFSSIRVKLKDSLDDDQLATAWSEIRDAIDDASAQFPAGVPSPIFDDNRFGAFTLILALSPQSDVAMGDLTRYAKTIEQRLQSRSGMKQVVLFGDVDELVRVQIDPAKLAQLGLTPNQVAQTIQQADTKVRAGKLRSDTQDYLIEVAGEIDNLSRLREIPLSAPAAGTIVTLGDIATIDRHYVDPEQTLAYAHGTRSILIGAMMEEGRRVDHWAKSQIELINELNANLPSNLSLEVIFDQSIYTNERLSELVGNLIAGIALVLLVLFFSLGWRGSLIVACVLPLTMLGSLAVMQYIKLPIHQMSVTGLIVALGLLVDAAIVMTDEIRQRLARGFSRLEAVRQSTRRLAAPLAGSTITTVLAFMPMVLLPGPAGDFVGSIASAVIIMLVVSFVLAFTITSALAGWVLPDNQQIADKPHWINQGIQLKNLSEKFKQSLQWSVRYPARSLGLALVLPLIGFGAFGSLTSQFFPGVERNQFHIMLELERGSSIAASTSAAKITEQILLNDDRITAVHFSVGESAPPFYYNMLRTRSNSANYAHVLVTTTHRDETWPVINDVQAQLNRALPNVQVIVRDLTQGPPVFAPIEVVIYGDDLNILRDIGDQVRERMSMAPNVINTKASLNGAPPKIIFNLDEHAVRSAGLTLGQVARYLDATLEGVSGGSLVESTEQLPITIMVGDHWQNSVDMIKSLSIPVITDSGYRAVPIDSLGVTTIVPSDSAIDRTDGERSNLIQGFIPPGVLPEAALTAFKQSLTDNPIHLPTGYRLSYGGDSDARDETVGNLTSTLGLVVVLSVATIVLSFHSFRLSLITFSVALLSIGLSLLSLEIMNFPFGVQALIGVIGSIGVSINAAIIILTALQNAARAGRVGADVTVEVVRNSSRHILSTTLTTFGGFLPLILSGGLFWESFAMAIAGGVLLSTVLSFYYTPAMWMLVNRKRINAN